jgi:peptide/nickel transport system substrate-binding protein
MAVPDTTKVTKKPAILDGSATIARVHRLVAFALISSVCACKRPTTKSGGPTAIVCGPTGCPSESGAAKDGGELRVHVDAEPGTLCDLVEHDVWSRWIVENQIAETLLFQDPWSGALGPRLAEKWEVDDKAITLHLREGVKWHDGAPFSAADVAFTLNLARDPKIGADQAADLAPISAVETPDARTVILRLGKPAPYLPQAIAHIAIQPKHRLDGKDLRTAPESRAPIGTGPFRFVRWTPGVEIVVEKNASYWGERAHVDRIVFRILRDKQVAWDLYRRGELDVMWRLPSARTADEVKSEPSLAGHRLLFWTPRAYFFIVWNAQKIDAAARKQLAQLVDVDRFLKVAFAGHARRVSGPYAPGTPSYDDKVAPPRFDASAKTAPRTLTFLATAGSRTVEQLATLLKEDLARAGVGLEVATVDWAVELDRLRKHEFDVAALQWTLSLEQDNFAMFHTGAGQNWGAWSNAAADSLMEKIEATADPNARHALDQKLHALLSDEQPYTFLCAPEVATALAPRVHGLLPSTEGFNFARAWIQ